MRTRCRATTIMQRSNPVIRATHQHQLSGRTSRQERDFSPRRPEPQYGLMRRQEQRDRKPKAKKPANGGPTSQVSTKLRMARLDGGVRSRSRTRLQRKFPANREKNREFHQIRSRDAIFNANTRAKSETCREIPYATEQGIFCGGTGNLNPRTGNLICVRRMRSRISFLG